MDPGREPLDEEEYQSKLAALRAAIIEGELSGPAEPFDFDAFIAERHAEYDVERKNRR